MKEREDTTICARMPEEMCQLNGTLYELKDGDEQGNHKAFDGFPVNIENGVVDSKRREDENGISDAACLSLYDRSKDGSSAAELADESNDLHFGHSNPFLNGYDHGYTDKNVLEYDAVKDIRVDMEKTDADDVRVRNGYESANPFLEPEEGEEDSTRGNECEDNIDGVTLSHQTPDEPPVSEVSKEYTNSKEETAEDVQEQSFVVTEEDARNSQESSNCQSHSKVHCNDDDNDDDDDEIQKISKELNAGEQKKSPLQPDGATLAEYSGPMIAYSGSISHRSDATTTSCRSFAFPIMQSEWDSSPVRMAKADKRHYRRRRKGWRSGLLCCRF